MLRHSPRRLAVIGSLALTTAFALVACGSSGSGGTSPLSNTVGPSTTAVATSAIPTTTILRNCAGMPAPALISAAVASPVAPGQVLGTGTCQYFGLNDQSKSVTLSVFSAAVDQANWNDLQTSLGAPAPYADPALPGALLGADGSLFVTSNGAIYAVQVNLTGAAAKDQVATAAKLLAAWLKA